MSCSRFAAYVLALVFYSELSVAADTVSGPATEAATDTVASALTYGAPDNVDVVVEQGQIGAHGLQLPATFSGQLPCADCEGINFHLDLWPDQGYHLRREWLGRDDEVGDNRQDAIGFWYGDPQRGVIVLSGLTDTPAQWQVKAPNQIRQLDMQGEVIDSNLPYELTSDGTLVETDIEDVFLGGMMTYMADAALFEECGTGRRYPIEQSGDYLAMERAYLADQSGPGAPLYVNVEGSLLMRPAMEGPEQRSLVVERFIRTRPGITCERQRADAALMNTYWKIDSLAGEDVVGLPSGGQEPHIILHEGDSRFAATVGCNRMMGDFTQQRDHLSFGHAAATLMACPPPLGALEQRLAKVLAASYSYRINGETLALYNEAGEPIAIMTAVYLR